MIATAEPLTPAEVEARLKQLSDARRKYEELKQDQKAELVRAAGKHAVQMVECNLLIEQLEEEIEGAIVPLLSEDNKTWRCPSGKVQLVRGQAKVLMSKDMSELKRIQMLEEIAPSLLCTIKEVNEIAVLAAATSSDKGLIMLADLAGITVERKDSIRITC